MSQVEFFEIRDCFVKQFFSNFCFFFVLKLNGKLNILRYIYIYIYIYIYVKHVEHVGSQYFPSNGVDQQTLQDLHTKLKN
jgi:hypothetical protein